MKKHSFNKAVLNHQWSTRLHCNILLSGKILVLFETQYNIVQDLLQIPGSFDNAIACLNLSFDINKKPNVLNVPHV